MSSQWLPRGQFYFRRLFQAQPVALCALLAACVSLICALTVYVQQSRSVESTEAEWRSLNKKAKLPDSQSTQAGDVKLTLPAFDNTQLVVALNGAAETSKLSLDEVSFLLDENPSQPYLRYRATLTVSSAYPAIRRFLDQVRSQQPDVLLDSITCTRDDITTVELTCDLALSAFYRKEVHG